VARQLPRWKLGTNYLQGGQFKQPNSLEELASTRHNDFVSKAMVTNLFGVARRVGVAYGDDRPNWGFMLSAFDRELTRNLAEGSGFGGRAYWLPFNDDRSFVHLGVSAVYQEPEDVNHGRNFRYRVRPDADLATGRLVDTGTFTDIDDQLTMGFEGMWVHGPFKLAGEYMQNDVSRKSHDDWTGDSWYLSGVWNITGETWGYKAGVHTTPYPNEPNLGMWQVGVRYDQTDLDDGNVKGGEEGNWTVGLNWYWRSNFKFMVNYVMVDSEKFARPPAGMSTTTRTSWNCARSSTGDRLPHSRNHSNDRFPENTRGRLRAGLRIRRGGAGNRRHRRRRQLPLPDLRQVVRRLHRQGRRQGQLPVDRFRRRHRADQVRHRGLRLERQAARSQGTLRGGPAPVPVGDRRRGAGDQREGCRAGQARAQRAAARRHLPRQDREVERSRDRGAQSGVTLPDQRVSVVHRSDGSGTSFNFTNYLAKVNAEWKQKVGEGTSVSWPIGIGGKGNEGVAAYVKQISGGIGYVELSYALQNKMSYAAMQNAAGKTVQPSKESFAAAAASADWKNAQDFYLIITNAPGDTSWPITATNFILIKKAPKDAARNQGVFDFFKWALEEGQNRPRRWTTCRCRSRWSSRSKSTGRRSNENPIVRGRARADTSRARFFSCAFAYCSAAMPAPAIAVKANAGKLGLVAWNVAAGGRNRSCPSSATGVPCNVPIRRIRRGCWSRNERAGAESRASTAGTCGSQCAGQPASN
jgi:hypothetical protein